MLVSLPLCLCFLFAQLAFYLDPRSGWLDVGYGFGGGVMAVLLNAALAYVVYQKRLLPWDRLRRPVVLGGLVTRLEMRDRRRATVGFVAD